MGGGCDDTDFHGLLVAGLPCGETTVCGVGVMPLHSVTDIVGEHRDAIHLGDILFQCAGFHRER